MPYRKSAEQIQDDVRSAALSGKLPLTSVAELRARGHASIVAGYERRGMIMTPAEQIEYDAIFDRLEARIRAETRSPRDIFSEADNARYAHLRRKRDTKRGLTRAEDAEMENLVDAINYAELLRLTRLTPDLDLKAQRDAARHALGIRG